MKNKGIKEKEKIVQILSIFWLNKNELLLNGYFKKKEKNYINHRCIKILIERNSSIFYVKFEFLY